VTLSSIRIQFSLCNLHFADLHEEGECQREKIANCKVQIQSENWRTSHPPAGELVQPKIPRI